MLVKPYLCKYFGIKYVSMLNRRLIRVKVFKVLFSKIAANMRNEDAAKADLLNSCEQTIDLYYFLLRIPVELKKIAQTKIDNGLRKFHPTEEEAHPNLKFVNNRFISIVENDPGYCKLLQKKGLVWDAEDSFLRKMYASVVSSDYFTDYMNSSNDSLEEDVQLIRAIYESEFEDNEDLEDILEDRSLMWMDDMVYAVNLILRNLGEIARSGKVSYVKVFAKEDDREFALTLLSHSMAKYDDYMKIVSSHIANWEPERLVSTDMALIVMGISEAVAFETIPVKVTINEYVDISKYYSTANSKSFVNGLLDRIIQKLLNDGTIVKTGRGLVGGLAGSDEK